jgi:beta-lactam-binding protein with PASTA domain
VTQPPTPPDDAWPVTDAATVADAPTVISRDEIVGSPVPAGPSPDRRVGAGMLLGLGAVALVALGVVLAYLLTHRHNEQPVTTTVTTAVSTRGQALPKIKLPDVTGRSFAAAQATLDAAGLPSTKREVASAEPAGTVVAQAPPAGSKLAKGSQIVLSVATATSSTSTNSTNSTTTGTSTTPTTTAVAPPPQNATMPDVTSQKEAAAVQAMNQVGILASLVFVPSQDPLGTVEQQAKPAGTSVPFHAHVQINLSAGPNETAKAQVPNVVGQALQQALTAINGSHLRLIYLKFPVTSKTQAGKVVQQSPLGGGKAPQNAQVLVYLGAYRVQ